MTPDQYGDTLTRRLRESAAYESLPTDPAALIRRRAEHARARRRTVAVSLGVAAALAGVVVFQQSTTPGGLFTTRLDQTAATPTPSAEATLTGPAPTTTPSSPTASASTSSTPEPTDDAPSAGTTATAWPEPPKAKGTGDWRPWTLPGADYGNIVAARMEDGHAVITVDRVQIFTADQWEQRTGKEWLSDFKTVNESTRTRQFVVADDATLWGNWLLEDMNPQKKYTPEQLVERINATLLRMATDQYGPYRDTGELPRIGVFLFHHDGLNGPVGYLEEGSMYTG